MATKMSENPPGWDQTRVQELADHYERQADVEALPGEEVLREIAAEIS